VHRTDRLLAILLDLQARGELRAADLAERFEVSVRTIYVDAAYREWRERGVETVTEPHNEPFGRTFAFKDPDGRVLHTWAPAS
jgi:hypothetical protein